MLFLRLKQNGQIVKLNQHDTGTINFGDPQFVKHLIEKYG